MQCVFHISCRPHEWYNKEQQDDAIKSLQQTWHQSWEFRKIGLADSTKVGFQGLPEPSNRSNKKACGWLTQEAPNWAGKRTGQQVVVSFPWIQCSLNPRAPHWSERLVPFTHVNIHWISERISCSKHRKFWCNTFDFPVPQGFPTVQLGSIRETGSSFDFRGEGAL